MRAAPTAEPFPAPCGGTIIEMTLPLLPDLDPADIAATLNNELVILAQLLTEHS